MVVTESAQCCISYLGAPQSALDVLRSNVALNAAATGNRVRAEGLTWGSDSDIDRLTASPGAGYDLILGSDLLLDPSSYAALLRTIARFDGCEAYLAYGRRHAGEASFVSLAGRRFQSASVAALPWPSSERPPDASPFVVPLERTKAAGGVRALASRALGALRRPRPPRSPGDCAEAEWAKFEGDAVSWAVRRWRVYESRECASPAWRQAGRGDHLVHLQPRGQPGTGDGLSLRRWLGWGMWDDEH